jgi:hypothetical protein
VAYDLVGRNRRAVAGGFAILLVLLAAGLFLFRDGDDPVVARATVAAIVRSVPDDAARRAARIAKVELPDGAQAYVAVGDPLPRVGAAIRLTELRHASGKRTYGPDRAAE